MARYKDSGYLKWNSKEHKALQKTYIHKWVENPSAKLWIHSIFPDVRTNSYYVLTSTDKNLRHDCLKISADHLKRDFTLIPDQQECDCFNCQWERKRKST